MNPPDLRRVFDIVDLSPGEDGIDEHQDRTVYKAVRQLAKLRGLLLADEVGLGKTWEALALTIILTEPFWSRGRRPRVLVVPAKPGLVAKWGHELRDRTGLVTRLKGGAREFFNTAWLAEPDHSRSGVHLCEGIDQVREQLALDGKDRFLGWTVIKPSLFWSSRRAALPGRRKPPGTIGEQLTEAARRLRWDVVVLDEAHHFLKPHVKGHRFVDPAHFEHPFPGTGTERKTLYLTATPFELEVRELLTVARRILPPESVAVLEERLNRYQGLTRRAIRRSLLPEQWETAREAKTALQESLRGFVVRNVRKDSARRYFSVVRRDGVARPVPVDRIAVPESHVFLSIPPAFALLYQLAVGVVAETAANVASAERPTHVAQHRQMITSSWEAWQSALKRIIERTGSAANGKRLPPLTALAERVFVGGAPLPPHPKFQALCDLLRRLGALPARPPGPTVPWKWVIFAKFQETQQALVKAIRALRQDRGFVHAYEGVASQRQDDLRQRFNNDDMPGVLVVGQGGSEGVDLQRRACHVVHYDLEWNPVKLEQREGRVDRRGNPIHDRVADDGEVGVGIGVYFLILRHTYDERVLARVVARRRNMNLLLGAARSEVINATPEGESSEDELAPGQNLDDLILDLGAEGIPTE